MGTKRKLNDSPSWWTVMVDEIRSQGGFVNSSLEYSASSRELKVENAKTIDSETVLMKIPSSVLVSYNRALEMVPWLAGVKDKLANTGNFHFPFSDICVAMAMAIQSNKTLTYLETLPGCSSFDALPRRWTKAELEELLQGSPLLERANKSKRGVHEDYDRLKKMWNEIAAEGKLSSFPSIERYSDMLAAVSSRAFGLGDDSDEDIAMIPILDLCNHSRGRDAQKNVKYKSLEDGSIEVKSTQTIQPNDPLKLTYGARGNSQLLLNYGFTLRRNLEPDGSSNDVLEFSSDGMGVVNLRTGPKSYTYGGLVSALEQVSITVHGEDHEEEEEEGDDMDNFLNEDEASEEIGDIYGDEMDQVDDEGENDTGTIQREIEALRTFRDYLEKRMEAYTRKGTELNEHLALPEITRRYFSALLLQSEQRTIYFFILATMKIESLLEKREVSEPKQSALIDKEDLELIETQTEELAKAFMKIRHGDVL